jgi:DNA-3-methyladenine glycosylase
VKPARAFYAREALAVAPELIGLHLVHEQGGLRRVGRIVETEAYMGPEDRAAHSSGGRRTARTEVMFGPPGHAYVYLIYGFWNCLNVVTGPRGVPHAVLLRAVEPVAIIEHGTTGTKVAPFGPGSKAPQATFDNRTRGTKVAPFAPGSKEPEATFDYRTWGPGLLCRAMHVDRGLNGADLRAGTLWIERPAGFRAARLGVSARIGVEYAQSWARRPWRFFDRDSPWVSTVTASARRRAVTDPSLLHPKARVRCEELRTPSSEEQDGQGRSGGRGRGGRRAGRGPRSGA